MPGPETEQGLERRHRLLAPIMAKDEFIKISLELMAAHAVMGSEQPLLQVADGAVGQRHRGLRAFVQVALARVDVRGTWRNPASSNPRKLSRPSV